MSNKKSVNKILFRILSGILAVAVLSICAVVFPDFVDSDNADDSISFTDYPLCVTFFDVGQGDGALISCEGYNILIDGGE